MATEYSEGLQPFIMPSLEEITDWLDDEERVAQHGHAREILRVSAHVDQGTLHNTLVLPHVLRPIVGEPSLVQVRWIEIVRSGGAMPDETIYRSEVYVVAATDSLIWVHNVIANGGHKVISVRRLWLDTEGWLCFESKGEVYKLDTDSRLSWSCNTSEECCHSQRHTHPPLQLT